MQKIFYDPKILEMQIEQEYYTVFHMGKWHAKNKHTAETAFCPLLAK